MEEKEIAKNFEKELFALINKFAKEGLEKLDLTKKMEYALIAIKFS